MKHFSFHSRLAGGRRVTAAIVAGLALAGMATQVHAQGSGTSSGSVSSDRGGMSSSAGGSTSSAANAEAAFRRLDANQDGKLSKDEANRMTSVYSNFDQFDADRDGFLNPNEFGGGQASPSSPPGPTSSSMSQQQPQQPSR